MIPQREWLDSAKRLPVGHTARVYHGAERRPNMVVRNLVDRYTCYCHSCHDGAVVMKEVVKLVQTPPPPKEKRPTSPGYLMPVQTLAMERIRELCKFLHSKDMAWIHIVDQLELNPALSLQDNRLVFTTPDQVVGRDLTGLSKAKWYTYTQNNSFNRAAFQSFKDKTVFITEDYFSAIKGQHCCRKHNIGDVLFCASMGTSIHADFALELTKAKHVVMMYDNDQAGVEGTANAVRGFNLLGISNSTCYPDLGKDPKNMQEDWFLNAIQEVTRVKV